MGSQMKHRPTGRPQRGRHPGVALHRRALSLAWAQSCPGSLVLSPSPGLSDPKMKACAEEGPAEIHRGPEGLSEWDRQASSIHTLHSGQPASVCGGCRQGSCPSLPPVTQPRRPQGPWKWSLY